MRDRPHARPEPHADRVVTADVLRAWRRRDLVEAQARYDAAASDGPTGPNAIHRRLSAVLGDRLARWAIPLAAYGHRRPPDQIAARLLDGHLLDEEVRS